MYPFNHISGAETRERLVMLVVLMSSAKLGGLANHPNMTILFATKI